MRGIDNINNKMNVKVIINAEFNLQMQQNSD